MSMVWTVLLALVGGALIGRAIRHAVPSILSLKDRTSLPFSSPWLEFVGAGVFALLALRLGGPGSFPLWWIFTVLLLAISATDYLVKLIPDRLTFSGTVLAIGWNSFEPEFLIGFSHGHRLLVDWWSSTLGQLPAGLLLSISGALLGLLVLECIRKIDRSSSSCPSSRLRPSTTWKSTTSSPCSTAEIANGILPPST